MNLRIRKKLSKRNNIKNYSAYKEYVYITAPANRAYEDYIKNNPQYKDTHNMVHIVTNKSKSHPRIMKLFVLANCYPATVKTGSSGDIDVEFKGAYLGDPDTLDRLNDHARDMYNKFMDRMLQTTSRRDDSNGEEE